MSEILGSWKEIATYFGKGVRTVQRWERTAGLPIHRPKPFLVLAYTAELELWLRRNDDKRLSQDDAVAALSTTTLPTSNRASQP